MWWNLAGLVVALVVTAGVSRLMDPPAPEKLEGTTLSFGGIIARERTWLRPYAVLLGYFVLILLVAAFVRPIIL